MQPKLTIITVVYNGAPLLEGTIQSVAAQKAGAWEYLIIDGASTDGTLDMIQQYASTITRWISEPDRGLYDAMNKGLSMARGEFVWFLNAGDHLASPDTLEQVIPLLAADTDVVYGEVMLVDEDRQPLGTRSEITAQRLPEKLDWQSLRRGMVVCHQAFIARRSIAPTYIDGNLTADIDWVIRILKKSRKVVHSHLTLADYLTGGVSKQRHQQSLRDRYQVLRDHYGWLPNLLAHLGILMRAVWNRLLRRTRY
jgi:glycosyltransferase involved in cell wall biosynthesis